jgi:hypothetical protein
MFVFLCLEQEFTSGVLCALYHDALDVVTTKFGICILLTMMFSGHHIGGRDR